MGDLRAFANLRELYVHGNRLSNLPPDMTGLRKLEKIDIRGNPFKDIPEVAASLSTIPNLKHLFMTINGTKIPQPSSAAGEDRDPGAGAEATAISEQEFDAVVDLFEEIAKQQTDAQSSERIDQHADVVMGQLDDDIAS